MERTEISIHEIRTVQTLRDSKTWMTNSEIAKKSSIAERTARLHTLRLLHLGLLDVIKMYPGYRYRWSQKSEHRNKAYLQRIEIAINATQTN